MMHKYYSKQFLFMQYSSANFRRIFPIFPSADLPIIIFLHLLQFLRRIHPETV